MNYSNFTNLAAETIAFGPPGQEIPLGEAMAAYFQNDGLMALRNSNPPPAEADFEALYGAHTLGLLNGAPLYVCIPFSAADVGKVIGMVPASYRLLYADERHTTPAGQACTVQVELLESGVTPGEGTNLLESPLDLALSANIVRTQSGNDTITSDMDAIALKLVNGDSTSLAGGHLSLCFHYVRDDIP